MSSSCTWSDVRPVPWPMIEWTPHELLPSIPPMLQYSCVDVSGAKTRPMLLGLVLEAVVDLARLDAGARASGSIQLVRLTYLEKSMTIGDVRVAPVRAVPPPRLTIGAPWRRQTATVSTTASTVAGDDHADRDVPVIRCVGGVEGLAAGVEADLAVDPLAEVALQALEVEVAEVVLRPGAALVLGRVGQQVAGHRRPVLRLPARWARGDGPGVVALRGRRRLGGAGPIRGRTARRRPA